MEEAYKSTHHSMLRRIFRKNDLERKRVKMNMIAVYPKYERQEQYAVLMKRKKPDAYVCSYPVLTVLSNTI